MSGPAIPGRFSFRFSRQPYHVTVDYTIQGRAIEGRPQVSNSHFLRLTVFIVVRSQVEYGVSGVATVD